MNLRPLYYKVSDLFTTRPQLDLYNNKTVLLFSYYDAPTCLHKSDSEIYSKDPVWVQFDYIRSDTQTKTICSQSSMATIETVVAFLTVSLSTK